MKVYHAKMVKSCCFECKLCDENVGNKDEVMQHNEKEHVESMDISRVAETHKEDSLGKFVCNFCGGNFQGKGELMIHMKKDYLFSVTLCRSFLA
jgi:hypothetical protein